MTAVAEAPAPPAPRGRLWCCKTCGKFSNAHTRPRRHQRRGHACGPFEEWQAARDADVQAGTLPALKRYRQSLLTAFETCPRRTRYGLAIDSDLTTGYTEATADLGSAAHEVFAEILRTLHRTGEVQMGTMDAFEVMYEVLGRGHWVLPADDREALRIMVSTFVSKPWNTRRILALEKPLRAEIVCPDGVTRTLSGRPDLLIADPPEAIIIVDYKTGRAAPKQPRKPVGPGEILAGKQYLSDRGHYQLDSYGLLALGRYPAAKRAILRELHLRSGHVREAVLERDELPDVERELGVQMQLIERGIQDGPESKIWRPRPGSHCLRQCPVAASCPIPTEQRGDGAIADDADADRQAARFAVVDAQRQQLRSRLKARYEATGYEAQVGDGKVIRYKGEVGSRAFGMHDPDPEASPEAIARREQETVDAMEAELARRQAA